MSDGTNANDEDLAARKIDRKVCAGVFYDDSWLNLSACRLTACASVTRC